MSAFIAPSLNDAGQVALRTEINPADGGSAIREFAIVLDDGGPPTQIARTGQPAPDGNGTFARFGFPSLNNDVQVVFRTDIIGASEGGNIGIYRADGATLTEIARTGKPAPDGNSSFVNFGVEALNDAGQVAFNAQFAGADGRPNDDYGIYIFDDVLGITKVARTDDSLLGSTIADMRLATSRSLASDERSGINELGQVAFSFELADGREGIAIWTAIPEPSSMSLLVLCGVSVSVRRCFLSTRRNHHIHFSAVAFSCG